ncbi:MAG TPA: hypothetical protein VML54_10520, partial [Candidatus Limnocylindrales bacterium]|nr:hypothetical protein [Candidatus Limnocylindrales bacterium]
MTRRRFPPPDPDGVDPSENPGFDVELDTPQDLAPWSFRPVALRSPSPMRRPMTWQDRLASVDATMRTPPGIGTRPWPPGREILYVVEPDTSEDGGGLTVAVVYRERKRDGAWTKPKPANLDRERVRLLPDAADRRIIALLEGAAGPYGQWAPRYGEVTG